MPIYIRHADIHGPYTVTPTFHIKTGTSNLGRERPSGAPPFIRPQSRSIVPAIQREAEAMIKALAHVIGTTTLDGKRILANGTGVMPNGTYHAMAGVSVCGLGSLTMEVEDPETGRMSYVGLNLGDHSGGRRPEPRDRRPGAGPGSRAPGDRAGRAHPRARWRPDGSPVREQGRRAADRDGGHRRGRVAHRERGDMAAEVSNLVRGQILQQAAVLAIRVSHPSAAAALGLLG
jgi:hypothetical protein